MRFLAPRWLSAYLFLCLHTTETRQVAGIRGQTDDIITTAGVQGDNLLLPSASALGTSSSISFPTPDAESVNSISLARRSASNSSTAKESNSSGASARASPTSGLDEALQTSSSSVRETATEPITLPLSPRITPALSVAGVSLILAGFIYTLIGVKNKLIQTFLSCAFLTSLSVTVLLVYVLEPPVRPAIQGAYLVAAFMTGVILGAGSLLFTEVTEGLGCLLGGYCLSMWILTLRPGGTLQSTTGRSILIVALTIAAYALSFYHRARPYALIGGTSIAGATATVLGVDCFSKAGLKEFWLYVWNLNDELFPPDTNNYPVTRGIKVELAVTIVICVLGVMSQLKLWKVINDRRQEKNALHGNQERERHQMEEAFGHRLEEDIERQRAQWEATYNDHRVSKRDERTDSASRIEDEKYFSKVANVKDIEGTKSSTNVVKIREIPFGVNEATNPAPKASALTEPVIEDARPSPPSVGQEGHPSTENKVDEGHVVLVNPTNCGSTQAAEELEAPSPPRILLPSAALPTEAGDLEAGNPVTDGLPSCEADHIPSPVHSRPSSLAATIDEELDGYGFVRGSSKLGTLISHDRPFLKPYTSQHSERQLEASSRIARSADDLLASLARSVADDPESEAFQRVVKEDLRTKLFRSASSPGRCESPGKANIGPADVRQGASRSQADIASGQRDMWGPAQWSFTAAMSTLDSLTKKALEQCSSEASHVVAAYRTNEWAKHVSSSDEPELDELAMLPEGAEEEMPAHVVHQGGQWVHLAVASHPTNSWPKSSPISSPQGANPDRSDPRECKDVGSQRPPVPGGHEDTIRLLNSPGNQESSGVARLPRSATTLSLPARLLTNGVRSSSALVQGQTLITSSIEEDTEAKFPPTVSARPQISPLITAGPTLLAQRDSFLRNHRSQFKKNNDLRRFSEAPSGHSEMRSQPGLSLIDGWERRSASHLGNSDDADSPLSQHSVSRANPSVLDDEDMPLSQRKVMLQQQPMTLLPDKRRSMLSHTHAHLPQRSVPALSLQKRGSMLATWRESKCQETDSNMSPHDTGETRRAEMMMEKQQLRREHQVSEASKTLQRNTFDRAMQSRDMQKLHREAMRRMQAIANKHLST